MNSVGTAGGLLLMARKRYGISASFMSEVLGFGTNTIRLYEKGAVPKSSHSIVIRIVCNPFGMKSYLDNSPRLIKEKKQFKKLYETVEKMCEEINAEVYKVKEEISNTYLFRKK